MNTQELEVIDRTDGRAATTPGTVIIHDEVYGHPSIISYIWDLVDALKEMSGALEGALPVSLQHLPEEYATIWVRGYGHWKLDSISDALELRVEHFEDFLKEHSGEWNYPDDVMSDPKTKAITTITRRDLEVIDTTDGDADTTRDTVIIHSMILDKPSIISYEQDIADAIEELTEPLSEKYKFLPEDYENAWVCESGQSVLDGYEAVLGVRIEKFKDFLENNSGQWTYPDDVLTETQKN